jgi:hypothetical protein
VPEITDSYGTPEDYRAILNRKSDLDDAQIAIDLALMSRVIDRRTGRHFTADAEPVARTFYPKGPKRFGGRSRRDWAESENPFAYGGIARTLELPDLAEDPESIKIDTDGDGSFDDETALAATDYQLMPLNAALDPEPRPYTSILIPQWSTAGGFTLGRMVEVTARWGWPAVPPAIIALNCQLVGILRVESARATRSIDEAQRVVSMQSRGISILDEIERTYSRRTGLGNAR